MTRERDNVHRFPISSPHFLAPHSLTQINYNLIQLQNLDFLYVVLVSICLETLILSTTILGPLREVESLSVSLIHKCYFNQIYHT